MSEQITKSLSADAATATVILGGVLNIESVAELRRVLEEALNEAPEVLLDARQLEDVDIPVLQTFCSACKTAAASGRHLRWAGAFPDCMKKKRTIGIGGTHMASPCRGDNHQHCIWSGGTC